MNILKLENVAIDLELSKSESDNKTTLTESALDSRPLKSGTEQDVKPWEPSHKKKKLADDDDPTIDIEPGTNNSKKRDDDELDK